MPSGTTTTYINYPTSLACPNNDGRPCPSFSSVMVMHLHVHAICLSLILMYSLHTSPLHTMVEGLTLPCPLAMVTPPSHVCHRSAVRHTSYVCGHGLHPRIHITLGRKKGDTTDSSELSCVKAGSHWFDSTAVGVPLTHPVMSG